MTTFDLTVLGGLTLRSAQTGQMIGGPRRKPLALLALLAAAGSDGAERDVLAHQLWPGDERRAAHSLSQALHALRHDLGIAATRSDGSRLFLNEELVRADLHRFRSAIDRGLWSIAAETYAGPFLDGVHFKGCAELERWIDTHRERFEHAHRMALRHLVDDAIGARSERSAGGTAGPTGRLRSFAIAHRIALVTSVVLTAGIAVAFALARDSDVPWSFTDAWTAEHQSLLREREHSTRGRVFIETPIVQAPSELDSLGDIVGRSLTDFVASSRVAHVVPRDSVVAVEAAAASEGGLNSPNKRMRRASAPIGVMTVLSVRGDSILARVTLERLVPPPPRLSRWSFLRFFRRDSSLAFAVEHDGGLETTPLVTVSEPLTKPGAIAFRLAKDVVDALDQMRSCSIEKHMGERPVPWCWRNENEPVIVKGYFHARRVRVAVHD